MIHLVGAGAALVVLVVIFKLFGKKDVDPPYSLKVTCPQCGWHGTVGQYNRVCRKCNAKIP